MILGIGIDSVDIEEMERIAADTRGSFARRTFTEAELREACARRDGAACLAGKFAVKEAVFKALAHRTGRGFDFRMVETLEDENGCPHVTHTGPLASVLDEAGARELLVSITNEKGLATAIAIAQ